MTPGPAVCHHCHSCKLCPVPRLPPPFPFPTPAPVCLCVRGKKDPQHLPHDKSKHIAAN